MGYWLGLDVGRVQDECKVSTMFKLDPTTGDISATAQAGRDAKGLGLARGSLYVANYADGTVSPVDPATGRTTRVIVVGTGPTALVFDGRHIWVSDSSDSTLSRINV